MDELVYDRGQVHELSRLEWDEHYIPYVDLSCELRYMDFFAAVSVITIIPTQSGSMRDYDYMLADKSVISHYSEHEAHFDKHLEVYPEFGWGMDVGSWYFGVSGGFFYRVRKWSAVGGYTQYPASGEPWSSTLPKSEIVGTIITYDVALTAPVLSLYIDYGISGSLSLGFLGSWYPYLHERTTDTHILRQTRFEDEMKGGNGYLADVSLLYRPRTSDIVAFRLSIGYEGIFPNRGTSEKGGLGSSTWHTGSPNAESQIRSNLFWVSLGAVVYPGKLFNLR
jgi:outer membrane protease